MQKNSAIKVTNLTKIYKLYKEPIDRLKEALNPFKKSYHDDFYALKGITFEIKKGETVGIIGRNGSGKSTLLKIITGILTPSTGRVNIHGKISAILELGAGFNPEMSGMENIYLSTSINGMSKQDTDNKIEEIKAFAELGDFIYQPVKTYSSGMKARLGFAVAINIEPDILIVDEALAVGDAAFQRKCFAKMEQIRGAGTTILFVSHSESNIVSLCTRAIWLSNGEKIIDGSPKLVTGLYMKNSQKKQIDKAEVKKEFLELEKNSGKKDETKKKVSKKQKKLEIEEFYDPSLKPNSTIYYEEKGARISDVKITTLDGKEVNVLSHGEEYLFVYVVDFFNNFNNVQFGMLLKTLNGIDLGGGVIPSIKGYVSVGNGRHTVQFQFTCLVNNGVYALNCSTRMIVNGDIKILHKIVDIYMIRVINQKLNTTSKIGIVTKGRVVE